MSERGGADGGLVSWHRDMSATPFLGRLLPLGDGEPDGQMIKNLTAADSDQALDLLLRE
jgi:hypothetical protein